MPAVDSVNPWKKVFIRYCLLYYLVFGDAQLLFS